MSAQPEVQLNTASTPGRRHRFGVRRAQRGQGPQARRRRHQADRPDHASPVPAAAVPGRHRHHLRGRDRARDPGHPAPAEERPGAARRRHRHRSGQPERDVRTARPHLRHPVRHLDRRGRCRPVLLRQRPLRRIRARHEDHRRRAGVARPHPARVRAGRAVQRPVASREAADVHRRRRRADRRRDGRTDRRAGRPHPQGRLPPHRLDQGAGDPARRRAGGAAADGREAGQEGGRPAGEDGRRDSARRDGHRRRPQRADRQGLRRHDPPHRVGVQGVVGRRVGQPAGQATSPSSPPSNSTVPAG